MSFGGFIRQVGKPMRLNSTLTNGQTDLFVRATLRDQNGDLLSPSTQNVPHKSAGFYLDITKLMPDLPNVFVKYKVFRDAAFLIEACEFPERTDIFKRDELQDAIDDLLSASRKADLDVEIKDQDDLDVEISDNGGIDVKIQDTDAIDVEVDDTDAIDAEISDEDGIKVTMEDC